MNKTAAYVPAFLAMLPAVVAVCTVNGKEVPCSEFRVFFALFGLMFLFVLLLGIVLFAFWLWMLVDCAQREFSEKLVWILLLVFTGIIGAILYYLLVKRRHKKGKKR